uniref:doublesex- and mab-3-related transcription factor C1 n=1 Tax=Arvicanthis niloticus TaxID=61156 RepID=UPI00148723C5|nr:doublesex- and mab-3-related transcription factor C1 [Arvicanthis niloticus]
MQRPSESRKQHGLLPAVNAQKKEHGRRLKRPLDQGVIKNVTVPPKFHKHGKRLAVEAEKRNEEESTVHKHEARPPKTPQEGSPQGTLISSKPQEPSNLPYTPVICQQQSVIAFSAKQPDPLARPQRYSSVIVQIRDIAGPLPLQPQAPNATKEDSVAAALEWQRKLEAAEALLALRNSPVPPPDSASPQQGCIMPNTYLPEHGPQGSAGEKGLQPSSHSQPPRSANSVSLTGSLDCMSFFT